RKKGEGHTARRLRPTDTDDIDQHARLRRHRWRGRRPLCLHEVHGPPISRRAEERQAHVCRVDRARCVRGASRARYFRVRRNCTIEPIVASSSGPPALLLNTGMTTPGLSDGALLIHLVRLASFTSSPAMPPIGVFCEAMCVRSGPIFAFVRPWIVWQPAQASVVNSCLRFAPAGALNRLASLRAPVSHAS